MTATLTSATEAPWTAGDVDMAELLASPAGLSSRQLGQRLVELDRLRRTLEAATIVVLDEADRSDAHLDDGYTSLSTWARSHVLWSKSEATTRIRELQLIRLCPEVEVALVSGRLALAPCSELARARANPRAGDQIAEHITQLLAWATELDVASFATVVRRWERLADVDGAHHDATAAHDGRRVSLRRIDDTFHLSGQFGVIQGAAMATILEAFERAEWEADWDAVKAEHGDQAANNMVARSNPQCRADALFAIFEAAVSGHARSISEPLVHLVCDVRTFEEHVARLTGGHVPPAESPPHADDDAGGDPLDIAAGVGFAMRRCETINGDPVEPSDVVAATLVGHVRCVIVDRSGIPVNAGRKTRLFRGIPRELVWLLGRTCCWRGCGHRVDLQVDHLAEYASRDGPTDQDNAAILDGRHNRFKTTHGYRITRDPNGLLHIWRPDGTELKPR